MRELTRYWINLVSGQPTGFGVTAIDLDDALAMIRSEVFEARGLDMPPVREVVENVDVSTLDEHVRPNMHPPNWRGIWFPAPRSLG